MPGNRLREIVTTAILAITFSNHVLNKIMLTGLVMDNEAELAGLPEWVKTGAAEEAKAVGKEGMFTLQTQEMIANWCWQSIHGQPILLSNQHQV